MKWSTYNQSLVRRGEILLIGFDVIDNWDAELKEMDKDEAGEPFRYPDTFLLLLGYAKVCFHLSFRQTKEGIAQDHVRGKSTFNFRLHYNKQKKDKQVIPQDKRG